LNTIRLVLVGFTAVFLEWFLLEGPGRNYVSPLCFSTQTFKIPKFYSEII
jgi:hypothetical protein